MREILFRGKRIDNGEWVEGNGVDLNYSDAYILVKNYDDTTGACEVDDIEVVPETVSQFTGLYDMHGTKVFEGDIIKYKEKPQKRYYKILLDEKPRIGVVKYGAFSCGCCYTVYGWEAEGNCDIESLYDTPDNDGDWEVIGNIHDNSELLT